MRRGRIFIYLALIIIIGVAAGWYFLSSRLKANPQQSSGTAAAQQYVQVLSAGQNITAGTLITEAMLSSYPFPQDQLTEGFFTDKSLVANKYAKIDIPQGAAITASAISDTPGNVNLLGSSWATSISQGLTAVSIPITRLSSAAYGIRDGDYVDVIATMLLVDVDAANQSALPNYTAGVTLATGDQLSSLTAIVASGGESSRAGRTDQDETLGVPLYLVPSEGQRPRLVTQMIMQNIRVLHVGTFPLPAEEAAAAEQTSASTEPTATPAAAEQQPVVTVIRPDIITVMVTPQDAVMLTYLIYNGAQLNLTLRNPADQELRPQPDAATLEYLLTQYNIPVPAKLPYSVQPRLDILQQPTLSNGSTSAP